SPALRRPVPPGAVQRAPSRRPDHPRQLLPAGPPPRAAIGRHGAGSSLMLSARIIAASRAPQAEKQAPAGKRPSTEGGGCDGASPVEGATPQGLQGLIGI